MTRVPYLLTYLAGISFVVVVIARIVMWSRLPLHVRWELYPVPHEPAHKVRHGGSYLEEVDWWKKSRKNSRWGTFKAVVPEVLFLSSVRHHNRQLWLRTFPFHLGMYLSVFAAMLALLAGTLRAVVPRLVTSRAQDALRMAVLIPGATGLGLGCLGALLLLHGRISNPELKRATVPADIFNLVFFALAFGCGFLTFTLIDRNAEGAFAFASGLCSGRMTGLPGTGFASILCTTTVVLLSLLVGYVPFTHMSHFVGKFFAYHRIRWNDEPNLAGGPQEALINRALAYKVHWNAEHIRAEGTKTWAEVALENPTQVKQ